MNHTNENLSLWLQFTPEINTRLSNIIQLISNRLSSPVFSPHLTLLSPFVLDTKSAIANTQFLAQTHQPICITCKDIEYQNSFFRSLYIRIELNKDLNKLRVAAEQLFNFQAAELFSPHVSLVYGNFALEIKTAIARELVHSYPTELIITELVVVNTANPVDKWKPVFTQTLGLN